MFDIRPLLFLIGNSQKARSMCGTLTSTIHLKFHTEEPGPFPVEDRFRFVRMVMDRLLLMRGTEALGAVRVFAVFVAVFMASLAFPDYAAALAASEIILMCRVLIFLSKCV